MSTVTGRKTWSSVGLRGVVPLQFFGGISSDFSCMPFQAKEGVKATHDLGDLRETQLFLSLQSTISTVSADVFE